MLYHINIIIIYIWKQLFTMDLGILNKDSSKKREREKSPENDPKKLKKDLTLNDTIRFATMIKKVVIKYKKSMPLENYTSIGRIMWCYRITKKKLYKKIFYSKILEPTLIKFVSYFIAKL